jgi:hypothetical protein
MICFHNCPLEENEIRETVVYMAYFTVYNLFIKCIIPHCIHLKYIFYSIQFVYKMHNTTLYTYKFYSNVKNMLVVCLMPLYKNYLCILVINHPNGIHYNILISWLYILYTNRRYTMFQVMKAYSSCFNNSKYTSWFWSVVPMISFTCLVYLKFCYLVYYVCWYTTIYLV